MKKVDSSFWKTIPGIITAIGGLLSAIGGFLLVIYQIGWIPLNPENNEQNLVCEYQALISDIDKHHSNGFLLENAEDIIQQDRANNHRFNKSDEQDQVDGYFITKLKRAQIPDMFKKGHTTALTIGQIERSNPLVNVRVFKDKTMTVSLIE